MKPKSMEAMLSLISGQKSHDTLSTAVLPATYVLSRDTAPVPSNDISSLTECNDRESGSNLLHGLPIVPAVITNLQVAADDTPAFNKITTVAQIEFFFDNNFDDSEDLFIREITRIENEALRAKQVGILHV